MEAWIILFANVRIAMRLVQDISDIYMCRVCTVDVS